MTPASRPNRAAEIAAKAARLAGPAPTRSSPTPVLTGVGEEEAGEVKLDAQEEPRLPRRSATALPQPAPRTKPVRLSVDVPPSDHASLMQMAVGLANDLGATRVHHQEVLRALLRLAIEDEDLVNRIRAEIHHQRRLRT